MTGCLAVWGKYAFPPEDATPGLTAPLQSWRVPCALTLFYLVSLPALRYFTERFLAPRYDMKLLLTESMVIYNVAQVGLNGWMVYRIINALQNGHPFIGDVSTISTGASYAVWVHYCDKYLEFFDTYFMVLRGKMDQVSFLHIYHHTTIAWAWWIAFVCCPGGDVYFGALLNSIIHVMMYSYYALALLKVSYPWKKYLTMAQLLQFASVVIYSACCLRTNYVKGQASTKFYIAVVTQVFEMVSLFVLFSFFFKRSYAKKQNKGASTKSAAEEAEDQCQKAVSTFTEASKELAGTAAKDASKLMASAQSAIQKNASGVKKEMEKGASRYVS